MIADIATGHTWGADICFLIGVILGGIAALLVIPRDPSPPAAGWSSLFGWAAVAVVALGFLLL